MINSRYTNVVAGITMIFVPLVYFIGVITWKKHQFSGNPSIIEESKHLYFVCFSSALYAATSVSFLLSQGWALKLISSTVSAVCAVILYEELRYGDRQWTEWSYWLIPLIAANYFVFYCIIERFKKHINYGR